MILRPLGTRLFPVKLFAYRFGQIVNDNETSRIANKTQINTHIVDILIRYAGKRRRCGLGTWQI